MRTLPAFGLLFEQRAQHPRRLLVHRQALGQQVGGGLVARGIGAGHYGAGARR